MHAAAVKAAVKSAAAPVAAAALVLAVLAVWVLGGGFGTIARERIEVADARVPMPSTPALTAVYLTVSNTGPESDELLAASLPGARQTMLMGNQARAGAGEMKQLAGIAIPAHGNVVLGPYANDITVEGTEPLRVGGTVTLTLTFRNLGTLTVPARVVAPGTP